jgi:hypothetical protein
MGFYGLFFLQKDCNPFLAASGEAQEIDQGYKFSMRFTECFLAKSQQNYHTNTTETTTSLRRLPCRLNLKVKAAPL